MQKTLQTVYRNWQQRLASKSVSVLVVPTLLILILKTLPWDSTVIVKEPGSVEIRSVTRKETDDETRLSLAVVHCSLYLGSTWMLRWMSSQANRPSQCCRHSDAGSAAGVAHRLRVLGAAGVPHSVCRRHHRGSIG